jgi:hypothetical protein
MYSMLCPTYVLHIFILLYIQPFAHMNSMHYQIYDKLVNKIALISHVYKKLKMKRRM